ncbi:hypothetical protein GCM10011297_32970 [Bacterioplanes sanyensis]|uniref:hypothetical protein n=1 Tax=Bacterioplanes sanyensis TaxID=1249553 RepID=UPI0016768554|nr:hypothetical protein [Bacterioplanes sanyensis]GGY57639.1 hypothetical protein GCM10011297_32970 [Bacterioplanes sanyensis]
MNENIDEITVLSRKLINILLVSNPVGTSLGVLLGIVLHGIFGLFHPFLRQFEILNILGLKVWHFIAFGVFSANIKKYLNRNKIDDSVTKALELIDKQRSEEKISEWEARRMRERIITNVITKVVIDLNPQNSHIEPSTQQTQPSNQNSSSG